MTERPLNRGNQTAKIEERYRLLQMQDERKPFQVEPSTISNKRGLRVRATITGFAKARAPKTTPEAITDNSIVRSMMRKAGNQIVASLPGSLGLERQTKEVKAVFGNSLVENDGSLIQLRGSFIWYCQR